MSEQIIDTNEVMSDFGNCCNGKVSANFMKDAKNDEELQKLIIPKPPQGVKLLKVGNIDDVAVSSNCCNGKVGATDLLT